MNELRINEADIADLKIASLPSRPTAPRSLGGYGYTATQMKAAFDKLPLFIVNKFNLLLESIERVGEGSVASAIPTGIGDEHTLSDMLDDIVSGVFATYLTVSGESLAESITAIKTQLNQCLIRAVTNGSKLTTQESDIKANETLLSSHSDTLSSHSSTIASHTSQITSLISRIASCEERLRQAENTIGALSAKQD